MKTSKTLLVGELSGVALDWVVAKCENVRISQRIDSFKAYKEVVLSHGGVYSPTTNWLQGGPIIERELIGLRGPSMRGNLWAAFIDRSGVSQGPDHRMTGKTALIAAMRCYVASKLGDNIDIPEELI